MAKKSLTPAEFVVALKAVKAGGDKGRALIPEGTNGKVDFTIRVRADYTRHDDYDVDATASIPTNLVIGLLVQRLGAVRGCTTDILSEVLAEAWELKDKKEAAQEALEASGVLKGMKTWKEGVIANLPRGKRNGQTKIKNLVLDVVAAKS